MTRSCNHTIYIIKTTNQLIQKVLFMFQFLHHKERIQFYDVRVHASFSSTWRRHRFNVIKQLTSSHNFSSNLPNFNVRNHFYHSTQWPFYKIHHNPFPFPSDPTNQPVRICQSQFSISTFHKCACSQQQQPITTGCLNFGFY